MACLVVLAASLLACVLPQAASAASGFALSKTEHRFNACPNTGSGEPTCEAIAVPTAAVSSGESVGSEFQGSGEKGGFDPKDLLEIYKLPEKGGSGETVAIVDYDNDIDAESDLKKYRETYTLPDGKHLSECTEGNGCFKKIDTAGETETEAKEHEKAFPASSSAGETSLDLDMVSAACSECHILLVEASGPDETAAEFAKDMFAAEEEAYNFKSHEATEISNSWDIWEGELTEAEQKADDEKYLDHPGLPITFASGDYGFYTGKLRWPGSSQYVISSGATRVMKVEKPKEGERAWTEEPWREYEYEYENGEKERQYVGTTHGAGSTSGCSKYEKKPEWQKDKTGCEHRTDVDAAVVGACDSPVSMYDTYYGGWFNECGTSDAAPFLAGVEALSTERARDLGAEAFYLDGERGLAFDVTKGGNGECGDLTGEKFTECHAKYGYETLEECGEPETAHYYWCHALVGYDAPTSWGAPDGPLTFTGAPYVVTGSATGVTETEETVHGTVDPEGAETKYYFEYGTTKSYGSKTAEASAGSGSSPVEETKTITGLTGGTTYDYRIVATNTHGTTDGANKEFKTLKKPTVETKAATSVTPVGATLNGAVNPNGSETKYYFEYGTTESYGTKTAEASAGSGTASIEESKAITGLAAETTYHFRIVAVNKAGTSDGAGKEFTTLKKPSVETKAATGITAFGATLNGTVNPNGSETKYYFEYGTTETYGTKTAEASAGSGTSSVEESKTISGLEPETPYDFRIVATNSGGTVYGANQKFTTLESAPVVVTDAATSITDTGGTLKGTVNPEGKEAKYYFEYGKTVSYGTKTAEASAGSGKVAVEESKAITGLEPEVTYDYRIVAKNSFGTADGTNHTFTTLASTWALQSAAKPAGSIESYLFRDSCPSSTNCMSVGEYENSEGVYVTLAEQWNGTEWKVLTTPNPAGAEESYLQGVSCTSSEACTATGGYYDSEGKLFSLAERWNGTEWKIQTTPSPAGALSSVLHVVSCKSSTECTAVGRYETSGDVFETLAERWNGTEWKVQTTPNPAGAIESLFKGVSCASSTSCIADGYYEDSEGVTLTLAESWNGTEWKIQTTPNPAGAKDSYLSGVSCTSSTACEANGWYIDSEDVEVTLAESWNGTEWKVQATPNPVEAEASILDNISCFSSTDCFASGLSKNSAGTYVSLAEHWNGTEWKLQTTPNPAGALATELEGVSCSGAATCTATGLYENSADDYEALAERSS
jgi:hypothetical protein